jgi:ribosome-associated protein
MTDNEAASHDASESLPEPLRHAVGAARDRKAEGLLVLDLRESDAFTDHFLICSGQSPRQVTAIVDGILARLRTLGVRPANVEGYPAANWVLIDCFDFIVHVFTPETRRFYALERLWGSAIRREV